ncbi:pilin N-terminal domain-containing protein [Enterococcus bulliens]
MKKLVSGVLMASVLSGFLLMLFTRLVDAETAIANVTMIIHEDESDSEQTTMGGRLVGLYDITSIYLEAKQASDFDEKKFSETWSDKTLHSDEGLPAPLKTATTNSEGECEFVVPMKQNGEYAVYLVREMSQIQSKKVLPSVIILPVRSVETNEVLSTIDVYPKYIDGKVPEKPTTPTEPSIPEEPYTPTEPSVPEEPYTPTETTSTESTPFGKFPSTNELKTKASWIGAGIILLAGILIIARKKQIKGERK